jgi:hypothetical protein
MVSPATRYGVTDSIRVSKRIQGFTRGMKGQQPLPLKRSSPGGWQSALGAAVPGICI